MKMNNDCPPHDFVSSGHFVICNKCEKIVPLQGNISQITLLFKNKTKNEK
jgi:hypothetical protein